MTLPAPSPSVAAVSEGSWASTRARIALLLVLLYAGASAARWLHAATEWPTGSAPDEISAYETRFHEVRSLLPAQGEVGYLGQPQPRGAAPGATNASALLHFRHYLLAQYALAPLLLVQRLDTEFILGNFDTLPVPPPPAGFRVMRDFGKGVVLFRRLSP